ncbi:MAG: hypothetical protein ABJA87_06355 [bacterium]
MPTVQVLVLAALFAAAAVWAGCSARSARSRRALVRRLSPENERLLVEPPPRSAGWPSP